MNTFSIKSFIKSGWQTFKINWKFVVLAVLATGAIQLVLELVQKGAERSGLLAFIISIFVTIIGLIITLGWARVILALNRNGSADWNTFKITQKIFVQYIKAMIWYVLYILMWMVIIVLPLVILFGIVHFATAALDANLGANIVFGTLIAAAAFVVMVYFAVKYQFINYVVLDYPELGSKAVFKKSGEMTKGHLWKLIGFGIVLGLLNLVGLICLVVGLLVTIPVSKLASARAYDYLKGKKAGETEVVVRPEEVAAPLL